MIKNFLKYFIILFVLVTGVLLATGKLYYYKALVYNYVNIDDLSLFATREVAAPEPQRWNISKSYNDRPLTPRLEKLLTDFKTVSFVVVKEDSIVFEKYWDGYGESSLSNSFSMAKTIVGMLVGKAIEEGKIKSIDQPVGDFIPEFKEGEKSKITVRHLLMMSSGLDWNEGYASLTSQVTEAYYGTELYKQVTSLKVAEGPGKYWDYKSCDTELLSIIIGKATGKTLSAYASEKIWKPVQAEHAAQWSLDKMGGLEKAYCCFYSNARDFARLGKLYLNNGMWNGVQVIDSAYVQQSITPSALIDKQDNLPNQVYGYQWWITNWHSSKIFYMRGILGQYVIVIPDKKIIIVRLGHQRSSLPNGRPDDYPVYVDEIMKMYTLPQ